MGRECDLIEAILNGESVDFEPKTKTQAYLKACCNREGCSGLPSPTTKKGALLYRLAHELKNIGTGENSLPLLWYKEITITDGVDATTTEQAIERAVATIADPQNTRLLVWTAKVKGATSGYMASLNLYVKNTTDKFSGLYSFALKDNTAKSISGLSGVYAAFEEATDGWKINLCAKKAATLTGDFNTSGTYEFALYAIKLDALSDVFQSILGI